MGNRALRTFGVALPFTIAGFLGLTGNNSVFAQVIPDNTVGTTITNDTVIRQTGNGDVNVIRDLIRGGTISGNALFHSFEEFNVGELREVIFDLQGQGADIEAIFTRVTGSNPSRIADILGVLEDAASFTRSLRNLDDVSFGDTRESAVEPALGDVNLFLLNPNGIDFVPGGRLRLNGSFLATTADGFEFEDGSVFSASGKEAAPPLLTISIPRFLSFRENPAPITNQATRGGGLRLPPENTFGLIAGQIQYLNGGASRIPDGRAEVGAVGSNATVSLLETDSGYQVSYEGVETFGDITLGRTDPENTRRSNILVDGSKGVGSIQLQGRNITLSHGSVVRSNTRGSLTPGEVVVNASGRLTVEGQNAPNQQSSIQAGVDTNVGVDDDGTPLFGASIVINTRELLIRDGGYIDILVGRHIGDQPPLGGVADSGDITINATDFIQIIGDSGDIEQRENAPQSDEARSNTIASRAFRDTQGNAGNLNITTGRLILENEALINTNTDGNGNAGNITVNTPQLLVQDRSVISANNLGSGNGGNINISVNSLSANFLSTIRGSNISIQAVGAVSLSFSEISAEGDVNITSGFFSANNFSLLRGRKVNINNALTQVSGDSAIEALEELNIESGLGEIGLAGAPEVEILDINNVVTQSACYDFGGDSQLSNTGRGGLSYIPGLIPHNSVINVDLVDEVLLPPPPPEAIKPHHRTDVTFLDSEGEEFKPAMGAVLLPNGMVEFVDYNPAEVYRDMYAAAGCNRLSKE